MSTLDVIAVVAPRSGSKVKGWLITILATVVSTYALDGIATAGGVLLVASGRHWQTSDRPTAGGCSPLPMSPGVRVSGSTCRRTSSSSKPWEPAATRCRKPPMSSSDGDPSTVRARRIAAAVGYVGTELAKEVPYYAAAFGVALASDAITSRDALIFLAGTNLGAAVYEYGLGTVTRICLRRSISRPGTSSGVTPEGH